MNSLIFFGAHPDDETMIFGGTLAMLAQQGVSIHIVSATRGEGGEMGEPPVAAARDGLGAAREGELRCAARTLGAVSAEVLGYVDPLVEGENLYPFEADFETLVAQVTARIRKQAAEVVVTHGADGEYGHPAHVLMHRAVLRAVDALPAPPLLYTIAAEVPGIDDHLWNENEPAHLALDVSPWLDTKERAALCHISQHALFKRRRGLQTVREALRTVESVRRYRPPVTPGASPKDPFAVLLRRAGAEAPL